MRTIAIVTGAGSGVGRALTLEAAARGFEVLGVEVDAARAEALNSSLNGRGQCVVADVRNHREIEQLAERYAGRTIGLVFANAGVLRAGRAWRQSQADVALMIDVNFTGVVNTLRCFAPRLVAQSDASAFVFTGSLGSFTASAGFDVYAATKHAVWALASAFAADMKRDSPHVRSVLFCPGAVRTAIADEEVAGPDAAVQHSVRRRAREAGEAPETVAARAFDALARGEELILLSERFAPMIADRASALLQDRLS